MYVDVKRKKRSESYLKRMFKGSKARAPAPPERVVEPSIYGSGEREKTEAGFEPFEIIPFYAYSAWNFERKNKYEFLSWYFFVSRVAAAGCRSSFEMASTSICYLFPTETVFYC